MIRSVRSHTAAPEARTIARHSRRVGDDPTGIMSTSSSDRADAPRRRVSENLETFVQTATIADHQAAPGEIGRHRLAGAPGKTKPRLVSAKPLQEQGASEGSEQSSPDEAVGAILDVARG